MANSYFRFKQFTIHQDQAAMKVCTDACLLGAYAQAGEVKRILDIGTGTGLLALMLAQRTDAQIDAVELEELAYRQALANAQASPFAGQVSVFHQAIQDFAPIESYDLIVSNPPFYTDYLQSGKEKQDAAWHTNNLPTADLVQAIARLLASAGKVWILLPPFQMDIFSTEAEKVGLFPFHSLAVRTLPTKPVWRVIRGFSRENLPTEAAELVVSDAPQNYSPAFRALLKDYYLHL